MMRILRLSLYNLNSLAGRWEIDFTHPAYRANGLFAITGPTGAGKTTLMDAICLALYGVTPRLGPVTKSFNEIMSRRTGECGAELTFETQAGRFRASWSQRRSRKNSQGALQEQRHEIADDQSGRVIESLTSKTRAAVESLTGMNFKQFKQSMMLAQGEFAAFLRASADERAGLLEQITGADIYRDISIAAHERKVDENKKLDELTRQLAGLENPAEEAKRQTLEQDRIQAALAELKIALDRKNEEAAWLKTVAGLEAERSGLLERESKLALDLQRFAPSEKRLDLADKASRLDGLYGRLKAVRLNRDEAVEALSKRRQALPALEAAAAASAESFKAAESRALKAKEAETEARPRLTEVRRLDFELEGIIKQQTPRKEQLKRLADQLAAVAQGVFSVDKHDPESWLPRLAEVETELRKDREALRSHREKLSELLAGRELSAWHNERLDLNNRAAALESLADKVALRQSKNAEAAELERGLIQSAAGLQAAADDLKAARELLNQLERKDADLAERRQRRQSIRSLEEHRARLHDGQPCPLCGAVEHPYARPGGLPGEEITEALIAASQAELKEARDKVNALTGRESKLSQLIESQKASAEKLAGEIRGLAAGIAERLCALQIEVRAGVDPRAWLEDLSGQARSGLEAINRKVGEADKLEKEISLLDKRLSQRERAAQEAARLAASAAEIKAGLARLNDDAARLRRARQALFGERQPDDVEKQLRQEAEQAEKALEQARDSKQETAAECVKIKALISETTALAAKHELEVKDHTENFLAGIAARGFDDEAHWLASGLEEEERAALMRRGKELAEEQAGLKTSLRDNAERLRIEQVRNIASSPADEVEKEKAKLQAEHQSLTEQLWAVNQKIVECRKTAEKYRELHERSEAQTREYRRWSRLHELIGSADGKKFRNFAQGLTFEIMIHQANRQLAGLSDRYLLIKDADQPLELKVIDNYQAGEIRSTKNLSGGESFIVSLALALGLSRMASQKVRVDSLFLDEGFGTLDEDSLEVALETLAGLNDGGKLIGVISHIPALVSRIPTQIKVVPHNGPHSRLTGPGVSGG